MTLSTHNSEAIIVPRDHSYLRREKRFEGPLEAAFPKDKAHQMVLPRLIGSQAKTNLDRKGTPTVRGDGREFKRMVPRRGGDNRPSLQVKITTPRGIVLLGIS